MLISSYFDLLALLKIDLLGASFWVPLRQTLLSKFELVPYHPLLWPIYIWEREGEEEVGSGDPTSLPQPI